MQHREGCGLGPRVVQSRRASRRGAALGPPDVPWVSPPHAPTEQRVNLQPGEAARLCLPGWNYVHGGLQSSKCQPLADNAGLGNPGGFRELMDGGVTETTGGGRAWETMGKKNPILT